MGIPSHGDGCITTSYPTRCQYCGDSVYYITCNHGSKFFLDYLGGPNHDCTTVRPANTPIVTPLAVLENEFLEVNAVVLRIFRNINFFQIFGGLDESTAPPFFMGTHRLRDLISEPHIEVEIRVIETVETSRLLRRGTFFMPEAIARGMNLREGMRIWVTLNELVMRLPDGNFSILVMEDIREL